MYLFIRSDTVFYTARGAIYIHSHTVSIMLRIVAEAIFFGNLATKKRQQKQNNIESFVGPIKSHQRWNGSRVHFWVPSSTQNDNSFNLNCEMQRKGEREAARELCARELCSLSISRRHINWPPFFSSLPSFLLMAAVAVLSCRTLFIYALPIAQKIHHEHRSMFVFSLFGHVFAYAYYLNIFRSHCYRLSVSLSLTHSPEVYICLRV